MCVFCHSLHPLCKWKKYWHGWQIQISIQYSASLASELQQNACQPEKYYPSRSHYTPGKCVLIMEGEIEGKRGIWRRRRERYSQSNNLRDGTDVDKQSLYFWGFKRSSRGFLKFLLAINKQSPTVLVDLWRPVIETEYPGLPRIRFRTRFCTMQRRYHWHWRMLCILLVTTSIPLLVISQSVEKKRGDRTLST